ncbi:hypothetical protein LJK88_02525 [Paenibacillus sp. P26]|nr:hypothetical protein LJK88_02525 [Paenibacillus sp. P26]
MIRIKDVRQDAGTMPWYEEAPEESLSYSLILMGYGKCIYWVQGEKLILEKGEAPLIPPGTVFYGKSIPSVSHDKFVVVYDVTAPDESLPLPLLRIRRPLRRKTAKADLLLTRAQAMHEQWREKLPYTGVLCAALLLECLTHLNREWDQGRYPP